MIYLISFFFSNYLPENRTQLEVRLVQPMFFVPSGHSRRAPCRFSCSSQKISEAVVKKKRKEKSSLASYYNLM
jgi:hypothetical protein